MCGNGGGGLEIDRGLTDPTFFQSFQSPVRTYCHPLQRGDFLPGQHHGAAEQRGETVRSRESRQRRLQLFADANRFLRGPLCFERIRLFES